MKFRKFRNDRLIEFPVLNFLFFFLAFVVMSLFCSQKKKKLFVKMDFFLLLFSC